MNRRRFLHSVTAGTALLHLAPVHVSGNSGASANRSRILIARDGEVQTGERRIDRARLEKMLDSAVSGFFGTETPGDAWSKIVSPNDIVGLKVNCLAGKGISTTPELVYAVIRKLTIAGVPADRIIIWDRLNIDLERAGFRLNTKNSGVKCFGNDVAGYREQLIISGEAGSLICRTAAEFCTVQISLPILKDHGIVGMTGALKNYFGAIHNPNKYHMDKGNPYIPDVYAMPRLGDRTRLIICDALTCQYEGGPPYMPQYCWNYDGIIVGTDPVAIDRFGWELIEEKRRENGMLPLKQAGREPVYIATAADEAHRLGTDDMERIEKVFV